MTLSVASSLLMKYIDIKSTIKPVYERETLVGENTITHLATGKILTITSLRHGTILKEPFTLLIF